MVVIYERLLMGHVGQRTIILGMPVADHVFEWSCIFETWLRKHQNLAKNDQGEMRRNKMQLERKELTSPFHFLGLYEAQTIQ